MTKENNPSLPWVPAEYDVVIVTSMQAVARGDADVEQQKRALNWIIEVLCDRDGMSFRPEELGGHDGTTFAEAKRFVGNQIVKMLKMNPRMLKTDKRPTEQG